MLKLNLRQLILSRGISKPAAFLVKTGISQTMATKLLNNETAGITHLNLTRICTALNCTPTQLYVYIPDPNQPIPATHTLNQLIPPPIEINLTQELQTLPQQKIELLKNYLATIKD